MTKFNVMDVCDQKTLICSNFATQDSLLGVRLLSLFWSAII